MNATLRSDMPILGVGTDIIEIERVRELAARSPSFVERVFTRAERDYCSGKSDPAVHLAGRFAAKEAVAKALGNSLPWQEVEISNNSHGKPVVRLSGGAHDIAMGSVIHISISHSRNYATAVAAVESKS